MREKAFRLDVLWHIYLLIFSNIYDRDRYRGPATTYKRQNDESDSFSRRVLAKRRRSHKSRTL